MKYVTEGKYPADALRYFEEISAIPRGSKNEKAIAEYLMAFAKEQGLWAHMDSVYNVYINKPASAGCENLPAIVLQGHTDIVCEKNASTIHNFEKDPLKLILEGDILHADGTTLGADNGVAVAYMMAMLARRDIVHPPIQCLFTSMEEIGLDGSKVLDPALIKGHRMINMDGGPEGCFLASAAGGQTLVITAPVVYEPVKGEILSIKVRGLSGGHSGGSIDKERGNSNKIVGRILGRLNKAGCIYQIVSVNGGSKSNAIPRECDTVLALCPDTAALAKKTIKTVEAEINAELAFSDAGFFLAVESSKAEKMMDVISSLRICRLLMLIPSGPKMMSMAIPGLVNASLNLGVVETSTDAVVITVTVRSGIDSLIPFITDEVIEIVRVLGASITCDAPYPAWTYDPNSPLRAACMELYKERTGQEGTVKAVHGGLECGIIRGIIPDMDIVALGPTSDMHHTPEEWLDLSSFARTYDYLVAVLAKLANS